ncbi:uncharacterized protein LOC133850030 [Drosophila sulfurigaster albostrigata]|uniref:uncharacterized protein LOC133850030 n=1 Tax=Drosophila sulfurigaster albostrigata TaxID=89887 RepID=UPI002D21D2E7|nr:uncharacterized protein LOC133850030 [Drosophila sulfurigaster albostrigata]
MWRYLFVLLALQSAFAAPISHCEQLRLDILQLTDDVAKEVLSKFVKLLQLVVDDAAQMEVNETERNQLEKMVKFIAIGNRMENLRVLEIMEEIEMIFEMEDESDESGGLIDELLDKHGIDALEQQLDDIFQIFVMQLENHIELYFIRNEQNLSTRPLDILLSRFMNEKDIEARAQVIMEIWVNLDC